ncbi:hypothetical protein ACUHGC_02540 [Testudinibacter sp. P27/CKL/0425]
MGNRQQDQQDSKRPTDKKKAYRRAQQERLGVNFKQGGYHITRHDMVNSPEFTALSGNSVKVLIKLMAQFRGFNNGDLSAPQNKALELFGMSTPTLNKALSELIESGFIVVTRQGHNNRCSLYAVTCWAIDPCGGKLNLEPTQNPLNSWRVQNWDLTIEGKKRKPSENQNDPPM